MNRRARSRNNSKSGSEAQWFAGLSVAGVTILLIILWMNRSESLDEQGCPEKSGPSREVVVLLDTSDPLIDKHKEELGRILREMTSGNNSPLAVKVGERVSLYHLGNAGMPVNPKAQLCHPGGNPEDRKEIEFTKSGLIIKWRWDQFVKTIESLFPEENIENPASPILETIAIITPRHSPSIRTKKASKGTHLIIISDLLQNTELLSHYSSYPKPEDIPRELRTDLSRVEVSLFRLERDKYKRYQTADHYYWWTKWVTEMGGKLVWQQAL